MTHCKKKSLAGASIILFVLVLGVPLAAQVPFEIKDAPAEFERDWAGAADWPLLRPGDIELNPDRIVGYRSEFIFDKQLHKEEATRQFTRTYETVTGMWEGQPILLLNLSDSGHKDWDDTFARSTAWYVERDTMGLVFQLGADPLDSTQRVIRYLSEKIQNTSIKKDGTVETLNKEIGHRVFSYRMFPQLLAAMDLKEGMKFRLEEYGWWDNSDPDIQYIQVRGRKKIKDAAGRSREVWVVAWITSPGWLTDYYISDEAPHYFGQTVRHLGYKGGEPLIYRETFVRAQSLRQ